MQTQLAGQGSATSTLAVVVLVMNLLWLGAGFVYFVAMPRRSTYGLIGSGQATPEGRRGAAGLVVFLGGLNLALFSLAALTLLRLDEFSESLLAVPITALMVGHGSQFLVNVPVAIREATKRDAPWRVSAFPMNLIFALDATLAVANLVLLLQL